jgi:hypothetical protein
MSDAVRGNLKYYGRRTKENVEVVLWYEESQPLEDGYEE